MARLGTKKTIKKEARNTIAEKRSTEEVPIITTYKANKGEKLHITIVVHTWRRCNTYNSRACKSIRVMTGVARVECAFRARAQSPLVKTLQHVGHCCGMWISWIGTFTCTYCRKWTSTTTRTMHVLVKAYLHRSLTHAGLNQASAELLILWSR